MKSFSASLAIAVSTTPRNAGSASSTVTSAPSRRQTLPISRPITPAPTTPSLLRHAGNRQRAFVVEHAHVVDGHARQRPRLRARWRRSRASRRVRPAWRRRHSTLPARRRSLPANDPMPWKNATLFFLNRYRMPSLFCATTRSLRASIFATSIARPATSMPWSANAWPGVLEVFRRLQQRLGRDAADVGARAARRGLAVGARPVVDARRREARAAPRGWPRCSRPGRRRSRRRRIVQPCFDARRPSRLRAE